LFALADFMLKVDSTDASRQFSFGASVGQTSASNLIGKLRSVSYTAAS